MMAVSLKGDKREQRSSRKLGADGPDSTDSMKGHSRLRLAASQGIRPNRVWKPNTCFAVI